MGKCPGGNPLFHWHLSLFPQLFHKAERARARSQIIHREREAIRQTIYYTRCARSARAAEDESSRVGLSNDGKKTNGENE